VEKKCIECEATFTPTSPNQKYCSKKCCRKRTQQVYRDNRKLGVILNVKSQKWLDAVVVDKEQATKTECFHLQRESNPKYKWSLTPIDVGSIIYENCHYCGAPPSKRTKSGRLLRNGIDRVDPAGNYEMGNVVPCCWTCNRMKFQWTKEEFAAHIEKIYAHQHDTTRTN
jgi:hypothetical protein